jgi:spermidine synthase
MPVRIWPRRPAQRLRRAAEAGALAGITRHGPDHNPARESLPDVPEALLLGRRADPAPAPGLDLDPGLDEAGRAPGTRALEYIQRMMAWLLFVDPATVPRRRAMQLGLGAGSLTKFCSKVLRMQTTAIEINPKVLVACRGWFKLPADNARMRVDAGAMPQRRSPSRNGGAAWTPCRWTCTTTRPPHRCWTARTSTSACRRLLTDDGCMTVNLFGRSSSYERSVERIRGLRRARDVAVQAHPRGQHRGAGAAHPARPVRAVLQARATHIRGTGACRPTSGCGCSSRDGALMRTAATAARRPAARRPCRADRLAHAWWSGCARTA